MLTHAAIVRHDLIQSSIVRRALWEWWALAHKAAAHTARAVKEETAADIHDAADDEIQEESAAEMQDAVVETLHSRNRRNSSANTSWSTGFCKMRQRADLYASTICTGCHRRGVSHASP